MKNAPKRSAIGHACAALLALAAGSVLLNPVIAQSTAAATPIKRFTFDYAVAGSAELQPRSVFDDGRRTYFKFPINADIPTFFVDLPSGQELLSVENGQLTIEPPYVVASRIERSYLLVEGRKRATVTYSGNMRGADPAGASFSGVGPLRTTGAIAQPVALPPPHLTTAVVARQQVMPAPVAPAPVPVATPVATPVPAPIAAPAVVVTQAAATPVAMPGAAGSAALPPARPVTRFEALATDRTVRGTLTRWAGMAGKKITWDTPAEHYVDVDAFYGSEFNEALQLLLKSLERSDHPLAAVEHPNVLRVVTRQANR